jgi:spermidine/putrescine transport system permease protein
VRSSRTLDWLARIPLIWYFAFLLGPLSLVAITSGLTRGPYGGVVWTGTIENYTRSFDPLYLRIFWQSIWLSLATSVLCGFVGFPVAWAAATAPPKRRALILFLVSIPFLSNLVIRIYALKVFTGFDGPLARALTMLEIPFDPYTLSQNQTLVFYGMATTYLPFMVFPLFNALERFDYRLVYAAEDLGATPAQVITKVLLPNLKRPLLTGFLLVFIPALGEFVIPDLLGGARTMLAGNLITDQFLKSRDWPFGSALAVVLIIFICLFQLIVYFADRSPKEKESA